MVQVSPLWRNEQWRLNHAYFIIDKNSNKIQFRPNKIQLILREKLKARTRILKSRQVGISTDRLIDQLDYVLFHKNVTACILAHEQDAIEKLFRIVRRAYDFMPEGAKPDLYRGGGSKYEMFFPKNNSRIYCDLESRGDTINWLHISEKAFIDDTSRIRATTECVPLDGVIIEETTPNGMNHFYDDWMDQRSNYTHVFLPWYLHDEYRINTSELTEKDLSQDEISLRNYCKLHYKINLDTKQIAYRRFKQAELKEMFPQEYPESDMACFLTSGNCVFDLNLIKPMYDEAKKPVKEIGGVKIFEERKTNENYVIGADTAEGVGGDKSGVQVFKVSTREQVASYKGDLKPSELADKLLEIAKLYRPKYTNQPEHWPMIGVERNNHGHAVILKLDEILHYPFLYKQNDKLGWKTDATTRPIMINAFIEGVENHTIKLNCKDTIGECLTLVNKEGKVKAEDGKHDDLIIAACIANQLCIAESKLSIYDDLKSKIRV